MLRRNNKKGFTLAELLIVVAIIAVLIAIAVPLFIGALSKAEEATKNANIRAVRGAAAVYLLENGTDSTTLWAEPTGSEEEKTYIRAWKVDATVSTSGEITTLKVAPITTGVEKGATASDGYTSAGTADKSATGYTVKLLLVETGIRDIPSGSGS